MSNHEIVRKTLGQFRTFLDELVNGTTNYRSLHNLTEQVEHQYHNRFLVELLQNAHDALLSESSENRAQRVVIAFEEEGEFGSLYIANDGLPLSASNFRAICNLGQSDKSPQESIGNKGIGFRSVLEISSEPHIYSRRTSESDNFDGYCFRFDPKIVEILGASLQDLANGVPDVVFPVGGREPLSRWSAANLAEFQQQFGGNRTRELIEEISYLSPYVMPIPIESESFTTKILEFQRRGLSTVVRLPLRNAKAKAAVENRMSELEPQSILFLDRLSALSLETDGHVRSFNKSRSHIDNDPFSGTELRIDEIGKDGERIDSQVYWVWQRTIGGPDKFEEGERIRDAVSGLPGKWHEVDQATVAIAVQKDLGSSPGVLNIYLPTSVTTGCAAHFSAPFYGDMSRTFVDFSNPFNKLLIDTIAELSVDIVFQSLAGGGRPEFDAILSIFSATRTDEGHHWLRTITNVMAERGIDLKSSDILLTATGWTSPEMSSLLPKVDSPAVVTEDIFIQCATFPVLSVISPHAASKVTALYESIGIQVSPLDADLANTIEEIAGYLHESEANVDWNGFWSDIMQLLDSADSLQSKRVLLGTDGKLHAADETTSVFFRPRVSVEDGEVSDDFDITVIPEKLRSSVAFLDEAITVQVPRDGGGIKNTSVHGFLSEGGLVETYGIDRIFSSVLVKALPNLPKAFDAPDSDLCRDILHWALKLLAAAKGDQEQAIRLLRQLPAPCQGGWFQLGHTSFGAGWSGKSGENLEAYLSEVGTPTCKAALKRLLLPPDHPYWCGLGNASIRLLESCRVFSGLRLTAIGPNAWQSELSVSMASGVQLPKQGPGSIENALWSSYRKYVAETETPRFKQESKYEVGLFYILPGLESWSTMGAPVRERFMQLVLVSMPNWDRLFPSWKMTQIRKIGGAHHTLTPRSFLVFFLQTVKWLQGAFNEETVEFAPPDRWYIPAFSRLGGIHQYSHLHPIPVDVASVIDGNPAAAEMMSELGMPTYQGPEVETRSPRLLRVLVDALRDPDTYISNTSVFLGQVRDAWAQFNPVEDEGPLEHVVVNRGSVGLQVFTPTIEKPVYIPDATQQVQRGLEAQAMPTVAIEVRDARRLKDYFSRAYSERVRFSSNLEQIALVDGEKWIEAGNERLLSEECPWLITLVLCTVAFSGNQSRGTGTKRFKEVLDVLRAVRLHWVSQLDTCWLYNDEVETQLEADAIISGESPTILAHIDAQSDLSQLADVLSVVVGRGDIDIPLKLLLSDRSVFVEYSDDELCQALSKLNVTREEFELVQQRWIGDFAWKVRLWRPLVILLEPEASLDGIESATNDEELLSAISTLGFTAQQLDRMSTLVNSSSGFKTLGRAANELFGDGAELCAWNSALGKCGEATVNNGDIVQDFYGVIESLRPVFRQYSREVVIRTGGELDFETVYEKISSLQCPSNYPESYWTLPFSKIMCVVVQVLTAFNIDESMLEALYRAVSPENLRYRLSELEVDISTDPLEIHSNNQRLLSATIEKLRSIVIAWATKSGVDAGLWVQDPSVIEDTLAKEFSQIAYIKNLIEGECIAIVRSLKPAGVNSEVWDAIEKFHSVDEIMAILGVSPADIAEASEVLKRYREAETRLRNTVEVCGSEFTNTSENLGSLMEHISRLVDLESLQLLDATNSGGLEAQDRKGKSKAKAPMPKAGSKQKSRGRMSQAMKDLVGLTGEIHAYRLLERKYGKEVVSPSSWKSENSRHFFPANITSDDYGCDIEIVLDGKIHYYEVKASQSDDESFEMGSSEIRLAFECANRRKRQYQIIHVLNALSDSPLIRILPNPYDSKQQDRYRFEEAGLRLRYNLAG